MARRLNLDKFLSNLLLKNRTIFPIRSHERKFHELFLWSPGNFKQLWKNMGIIDFFFLFLLLTRIRVITEKFSSREIFKQLYYVKFQERIFDFPLFAQLMKNSRSVKFEKFEKFDRHIPFITLTFDYPRLIAGLYANSYAARIIGENIRFLSAMNHFNSCRDVICVRFSRLARHCPPFHVDLEIKRFIGMDNHRIVL